VSLTIKAIVVSVSAHFLTTPAGGDLLGGPFVGPYDFAPSYPVVRVATSLPIPYGRAKRLKDVGAAGGWKDVSTLLEVYQQSDEESVLAVTSVTLKLRERGVA
jgi:hypothetical protein